MPMMSLAEYIIVVEVVPDSDEGGRQETHGQDSNGFHSYAIVTGGKSNLFAVPCYHHVESAVSQS